MPLSPRPEQDPTFSPTPRHQSHRHRKALVIGFACYPGSNRVPTARESAQAIKSQLTRNRGSEANFSVRLLTESATEQLPYRNFEGLCDHIARFFQSAKEGDTGLFYFVGHGDQFDQELEDATLVFPAPVSDGGLYFYPLSLLIELATASRFRNVFIILDSCYSGAVGRTLRHPLRPGISILTSTSDDLQAYARDRYLGHYSLFSGLVKQALEGKAADPVTGIITMQSIYDYVCQSIGRKHRPALICNATDFMPVKWVKRDLTEWEADVLFYCFQPNDREQWPFGSNWLYAHTQIADSNFKPEELEVLRQTYPSLEERGYIKKMTGTDKFHHQRDFYILTTPGRRVWEMKMNDFFEMEY